MTDTHTHLYMPQYEGDEAGAVERALAAGVRHLVFPNVDLGSIAPMRKLHALYPEATAICMGVHPTELGPDPDGVLATMEEELNKGGYAAIGEVGLDLHWPDAPSLADQQRAFAAQIKWGAKYGLPVIIHSRDARDETLEVIANVARDLDKEGHAMPELIFHSFTGTPEDVEAIRRVCDPWFGINGVVTFKNAPDLRKALPVISLDRMLTETDAPYLAPVPHRGQRNESAYIPLVVATIADVLGVTPEEVERITDANARQLFFRQISS